MKELLSRLTDIGLAKNEAKTYLFLLQNKPHSANQIAKKKLIDRTLVYQILNKLIGKGLVSYFIKEKKKFFKAERPKNLLGPITELHARTTDLITDLNKIKTEEQTNYEVNIFEGRQGLRNIITQMLNTKEVLCFGATGKAYDFLYELPRLSKKSSVRAKVIANNKLKKHPINKIKNIQIKFSDAKSKVTTTIFDDKVAIHSVTKKPFSILIKNKDIAETYKEQFEILWKNAK